MPLLQISHSARLRNKENTSQDPQSFQQTSPSKQRTSPQKSFLSKQLKQITQLKIRLSDTQFEVKKLEQDCTVKLATVQKQLIKERNEKKQLMKQCKEKVEEDRLYFERRIADLEQAWREKMLKVEQDARKSASQHFDQEISQLSKLHKGEIKELTCRLQQLGNEHMIETQLLLQRQSTELTSLSLKFSEQLQQVSLKSSQEIRHLKQQHLAQSQFYHQREEQKAMENQTVVKILTDKIRKLEMEMRSKEEKVQELMKEIQIKQQQLIVENRAKDEYRLDKVYLQRKVSRLEPDIKDQYQIELQQAKVQYETSLDSEIARYIHSLATLQTVHSQSTSNYEMQLSQMEERCREFVLLHETIKSNQQDVKKIEMLEMKLIKKEMEMEKEKEDVKMCKLELNNMDQIFHKMFEEAKFKGIRPKRSRLPSLLSVGQHRSTVDCYTAANVNESTREKKKFSIREINNYNSMHKAKESRQLNSDFAPYQ